ncbi:MAG: SDR family oxidoreductase, partial [Xenococcaceae cyanobacterium]
GDVKISHVDTRDVAAVAAVCLCEMGHENKSYVLTGSEAISFDEVAEIFTKELNRPINYINLPPQDLKAARLENGEPEWYLDAELELFACWEKGAGSTVTDAIAEITARSPITFSEFARYFVYTQGIGK